MSEMHENSVIMNPVLLRQISRLLSVVLWALLPTKQAAMFQVDRRRDAALHGAAFLSSCQGVQAENTHIL